MPADMKDLEADVVQLARIALTGRAQDIQVFLHRLAKRYRQASPTLADQIAQLLRDSPTRATPLRRQAETPMPVDVDSRLHLLRIEEAPHLDHEIVLATEVRAELDQLVRERRSPEALQKAGLEPARTSIFVGPPGVGKTMAARWLARELGRPLIILDLAAVMSSYLGRTGTNLRHVLDYAKTIDCVLLLDELDAIAKRRDDRGEIGELKRLVTVLIQQIDDWPSSGLLIAATNHPALLDPAIWRRFEAKIEFQLPGQEAIQSFVQSLLGPHTKNAANWSAILAATMKGLSYSDIETEVLRQRRAAAVGNQSLEDILAGQIDPSKLDKQERIELAANLASSGMISQRKASELTGVARDTIRDRTGSSKRRSANAK